MVALHEPLEIHYKHTRSFHLFFFFQAEDGIRDLTVTGVQTCALPISSACAPRCGWARCACSANSSPRRSRVLPRTTTKRQGRKRPWSGARTALDKMSSSAPSSGAGSVSSRAERRLRRASMACIGVLYQHRAVLPLSEACERNKGPILEVLRSELATSRSGLEVGSGTGQHAEIGRASC